MSNITTTLIDLRHHYTSIVAQSKYKAAQAKAQLAHIDALLSESSVQAKTLSLISVVQAVEPAVAAASTSLISRSEVDGAEQSTSSSEVPELRVLESKRNRKAKQPYSRESLRLRPEYEGMTKLEAITKALSIQLGVVLHQDSIIQSLYGDLSADQMRLESRRMRASLFQGLKKNLWKRAEDQPSSYIIDLEANVQLTGFAENEASRSKSQAKSAVKASAKPRVEIFPKLTRLKPGRPPKASKVSRKPAKSEPKRLEVVALLRKPSFTM